MRRHVDEAFAALQDFHSPQQNFVLADTAGNIGFVAAGRVPVRKMLSANSMMPAPGWDGDYDWAGFLPFKELPQVKNPPEGFIATANSKITPEGYSHFITGHWQESYRQDRIQELLRADAKVHDGFRGGDHARHLLGRGEAATRGADAESRNDGRGLRRRESAQSKFSSNGTSTSIATEAAPLILTTWLREADKALFAATPRR